MYLTRFSLDKLLYFDVRIPCYYCLTAILPILDFLPDDDDDGPNKILGIWKIFDSITEKLLSVSYE